MWNWRKLYLFLILPALLVLGKAAHGGHITGGNITYECLGGEEYLVSLSLYHNCTQSSLLPNQFLKFSSDCGDFFSLVTPQVFSEEISQLCSSDLPNSTCNDGPLPGMEIYKYQVEVTLPACNSWEIYWELCTRVVTDNVNNMVLPCLKVNAVLNNAEAPCNNSAFITQESIPSLCVNQPVIFNAGVNENDEDSLRFYLVPGLNAGGAPIVYEPGFSGESPIPGIAIDNNSGQLSFTPLNTGTYTVVIEVEEFNSQGILIGTIRHDIVFEVRNCSQFIPEPDSTGFSNFTGSGALIDGNIIQVCEGDQFCAEMEFSSDNPESIITLTSQAEEILPGATFTTTGTNPVIGEVCWTAPEGFSNTYHVIIAAQDDECPAPGMVFWGFAITPESCLVLSDSDTKSKDQPVLFPNPNSGSFHVAWPVSSNQNAALELFDSSGRMVWQSKVSGVKDVSVRLPMLPAGHYILKWQVNESIGRFPMVIHP